jgi:transposase
MANRRRTRRFTPEFIEQAVQMVRDGRQQRDVGAELGIGRGTLCRWCARAEGREQASELMDVGAEPPGQEVLRLRKRVRELELEKEILKKAAAFVCHEHVR